MESIEAYLDSQLALLEKARQAELKLSDEAVTRVDPKVLSARGLACLNLSVSRLYTGLGGKTIVDLTPDSAVNTSSKIPIHTLKPGDIVRIEEQPSGSAKKQVKQELKDKGLAGVVVRTTQQKIAVALNSDKQQANLDFPRRMWLIKIANDAPYKRMIQAITDLKTKASKDLSAILRLAFGISKYMPPTESTDPGLEFLDERLNESQKEAIKFALKAESIAFIHGPPGTGKTHTLIEIIRQLVGSGLKVLVCGPSNISVDNIADKLAAYRVPMVRVGHPARVLPTVLSSSLDYVIQTSDAGMLVKDIRREMDEKLTDVKKARNAGDRRRTWDDIRELRRECKQREIRCTQEIMRTSKVVLSTLHGAGGRDILGQKFDVIIIDEAGQALEAQCWIAMLNATKCILAGDHLQLGPTVPKADGDEFRKLELSLFERLINLHGPKIKKTLSVQYRMHQVIMEYPSNTLYEATLTAADSVHNHLLSDLTDVEKTEDTQAPLVFWDTQGGDFRERVPDEGAATHKRTFHEESKSNPMEAALCNLHVRNLVKTGVKPSDIAVITPYNAQVTLLSEILKSEFPELEIGSVDGFQGREKEAIVLSLVRSNDKREVGFLSDERRLNVAMTRPRRHLCVIGDSETVSRGSRFLKGWMAFLEENADLRYPDPSDLQH